MLRRQLRHMQRYLSMTLMLIGMPIVFLLLFVYIFGGTLGAGLGGAALPARPSAATPSPLQVYYSPDYARAEHAFASWVPYERHASAEPMRKPPPCRYSSTGRPASRMAR